RHGLESQRLRERALAFLARPLRYTAFGVDQLRGELFFARPAADGHGDRAAFAVADHLDVDPPSRRYIGDEEGQRLVAGHLLAVDAHDHVARQQAGLLGGFARLDRLDELTAVGGQAERPGQVLVHRLDAHTEVAAQDLLAGDKLLDDRLGGLGRDCETDADAAARGREDRVVDPDHVALHVEQRTAGVAAIDAGVGLDVAVVGARSGGAVHGRDDAAGDGAAKAERVADRDHPVADPRIVRSAELDVGERLVAGDLEYREIRGGVAPDDFGRILGPVGRRDGDFLEFSAAVGLDHVIVGNYVAIGRDDEARPERLRLARGRLAASAIAEQVGERGAGKRVRVDRDLLASRDVDDRRRELLGQVGKARGRARAGYDPADLPFVVLGDLRTRRDARDQGHGRPACQQGRGDAVGVAHGLHVLLFPSLKSSVQQADSRLPG